MNPETHLVLLKKELNAKNKIRNNFLIIPCETATVNVSPQATMLILLSFKV